MIEQEQLDTQDKNAIKRQIAKLLDELYDRPPVTFKFMIEEIKHLLRML